MAVGYLWFAEHAASRPRGEITSPVGAYTRVRRGEKKTPVRLAGRWQCRSTGPSAPAAARSATPAARAAGVADSASASIAASLARPATHPSDGGPSRPPGPG
jgi:hypothetical protein